MRGDFVFAAAFLIFSLWPEGPLLAQPQSDEQWQGSLGEKAKAILDRSFLGLPGEPPGFQAPETSLEEAIGPAIERGLSYLASKQLLDGSWQLTGSIDGSNPFIRSAVTAICLLAFRQMGREPPHGRAGGLRYVHDKALSPYHPYQVVNDRLYALSYGLLTALEQGPEAEVGRYLKALEGLGRRGFDYVPGHHARGPSSFQIALVLLSLHEAQEKGYALPEGLQRWLLADLERCRHSGLWGYHMLGGHCEDGQARGSLCELARFKAKRGSREELWKALRLFVDKANLDALDATLDPGQYRDREPHSGPSGRSNYYYLFGFYWSSRALGELMAEAQEARKAGGLEMAKELAGRLLKNQKEDGSWEDSPGFSGPAYGTAYAVMALDKLRAIIKISPQ